MTHPPGSLGLPFVGETPLFVLKEHKFYEERLKKHGPIFKSHIMGNPCIVVTGDKAVEFILSKGMDNLSWGNGWPGTFKELLGRSLFVQDGEEHRKKRRLLMNAFRPHSLISYIPKIEDHVLYHLELWEKEGQFPWFPHLKTLTFDIASDILLGQPSRETARVLSDKFNTLTKGFFTIPTKIPGTPYHKAIKARDYLLKHIDEVIEERAENPGKDAISYLIQGEDEEGNKLTHEELSVQALLLLFAGHDTTTSLTLSILRKLAEHPDVLLKARQEQAELNIEGRLSKEQLNSMPYLDCIIKETERMCPAVNGGFRGIEKTFEWGGYTFPKGWKLLYNIPETNNDPSNFPEPLLFKPERHLNPPEGLSKFSIVTFGGGPRLCLGMAFAKLEIKIILSYLLRNYEWEPIPNQDLRVTSVPIRLTKSGYIVDFKKRN